MRSRQPMKKTPSERMNKRLGVMIKIKVERKKYTSLTMVS